MRTSFSPGLWTVLYYCVATPIAISLTIGISVLADRLADLPGLRSDGWLSTALFVALFVAAFISKYFLTLVPVFGLFWLGRRVRHKEQRNQQVARDEKAAKLAKEIRA